MQAITHSQIDCPDDLLIDYGKIINLISNQFLSLKELSEKINLLMTQMHKLFKELDWSLLLPEFNIQLARIFNSRQARVWIVDAQQGMLVTWDSKERKCLISKGMISECFFNAKPINSKNARNKPLLYILNKGKEEPLIVDTCLLLPICDSQTKQVKMMVEVSSSLNEIFSFDEEYLSIILVHYLSAIVTTKYIMKFQQHAIKFNSQLIEEFDCLMYSKSKFDFINRLKQAYTRCFGISNLIFYFVEGENMIKYNQKGEQEKFSLSHGLVGQSVQDMKPYIITDIKRSTYYNKLVDLNSILPVFAIPLIDQENKISKENIEAPVRVCIGVIEIAIKQKFRSEKADILIEGFSGYFGLEESLSIKVQQFSQIVAHAIRTLKNKNLPGYQ